ncbi:MAG: hypothetical protein JSV86_04910 [Gemmatimonadota bacterium]|nr:MAG: hypothetical protein JSV86_04910 [Gemmatimonadota bacterium]
MKPPREQGATDFTGMDVSMADTAPVFEKAVEDTGGNHQKAGAWRTRRGFSRGFEQIPSRVNLVVCWEAENEQTVCVISGGDGYYTADPFPVLQVGYGTGGYGSQPYGD